MCLKRIICLQTHILVSIYKLFDIVCMYELLKSLLNSNKTVSEAGLHQHIIRDFSKNAWINKQLNNLYFNEYKCYTGYLFSYFQVEDCTQLWNLSIQMHINLKANQRLQNDILVETIYIYIQIYRQLIITWLY